MHGEPIAFEISLNPRQSRRWHIVMLWGQVLRSHPQISLTFAGASGTGPTARRFVPIRFGRKILGQVSLVCTPAGEQRMAVEVHGEPQEHGLSAHLIAVPQLLAALILICLQPSILLPSVPGKRSKDNATLRNRLALAALKLGKRISYPAWRRSYDCWQPAAANTPPPGKIMSLVFTSGDQDRAALDASLTSLAAASRSMPEAALPVAVIDGSADHPGAALRAALQAYAADFVVVLQAGEVITPYAIGALARFAVTQKLAIVYADEDRIDFEGKRSDPVFKPEPSRMLMLSGALATGIFLIRGEVLAGVSETATRWADALRLDAWLRLTARAISGSSTVFSGRLPFILTHRRPDIAVTPPDLLAVVARAHLGPTWQGEIDAAQLPLRIRPGIAGPAPKVSLIVPSTARLTHVRSCLSAILKYTRYPNFEMIIVLSQNPPLSTSQQSILAPILTDRRVRIVFAPMRQFNYSSANNVAVSYSSAPLICLLNDDVAPITPDWLAIMVGHLQDPYIAAVGAKLYYPEQTVQHGGVIMGLGGLCDHSFRFLPRMDAGYAGRASVEQELSAVTGACLLIRKPVFDAVGGLDETFASAFNDVDLCMKIREAGHGIIWSAQAELWHHETVSFGRHYAGERLQLEQRDIHIMRKRWAAQCAADPFHNPNLSLDVHSEWQLAVPPRLGDLPEAVGLVAQG